MNIQSSMSSSSSSSHAKIPYYNNNWVIVVDSGQFNPNHRDWIFKKINKILLAFL